MDLDRWINGLTCTLIASVCIAVSFVLQKKSLLVNSDLGCLRRCSWWLGLTASKATIDPALLFFHNELENLCFEPRCQERSVNC